MEWTVVTVLIALVGLFATVAKPIMSLQKSITSLEVTIKSIDERLAKNEGFTMKQQEQLENHETRITVLEAHHKGEKL